MPRLAHVCALLAVVAVSYPTNAAAQVPSAPDLQERERALLAELENLTRRLMPALWRDWPASPSAVLDAIRDWLAREARP
jgi:hypothetical protein